MELMRKIVDKLKTGIKLPSRKGCVIEQPTNAVLRLPLILLGKEEKILGSYQKDLFLP